MNQRVEEASAVSGVRMMEKTGVHGFAGLPAGPLPWHRSRGQEVFHSRGHWSQYETRECVCHNIVNSMNMSNHRGEL